MLSVLTHTLCAALRRRLPGYGTAVPDTIQRRFLNTDEIITSHGDQITARLNRRTYHRCSARLPCPRQLPSPAGKAAPSAMSTPDPD